VVFFVCFGFFNFKPAIFLNEDLFLKGQKCQKIVPQMHSIATGPNRHYSQEKENEKGGEKPQIKKGKRRKSKKKKLGESKKGK